MTFLKKSGLALLAGLLLLANHATVFAQASDSDLLKDIRDVLNDIGALLNNTIEQATTLLAEMSYTETPNLADSMLVNLKYKQEAVPIQAYAASNLLNKTISLYLNPLELHTENATHTYTLMPGSEAQVAVQVPNFMSSSILDKSGISANSIDANYAQNFINALIDLDNTPKSLKFVTFANLTNPQANYLTALASYIAAQSVAIHNLYDSYAKRLVIPNLGKNAGMIRLYPLDENDTGTIGETVNDASPLQVDEYLANRRTMNPKWYTDMEAAPPATVQREMLYVLAELRQEMFKQRMALEKLTANMASFQIQQSQQENRQKFLVKPPEA